MPRKTRSFSPPMLQKVLKISIFVAKKLRKPITAKMVLLRDSRKVKKFRLLRHYNDGFVEEFQFSPSGRNRFKDKVRDCRDDLLSMVFMCKCLGGGLDSEADNQLGAFRDFPLSLPLPLALATVGGVDEEEDDAEDEEDNSVDWRAERFIERFYQEMRLQRRLSV